MIYTQISNLLGNSDICLGSLYKTDEHDHEHLVHKFGEPGHVRIQ